VTTTPGHRLMRPGAGSHEDAALLAFVDRCRRRASLVLFHRYLSVACAAVCLGSAAVLVSGVEYTFELGIGATAIAIAGSALSAFRFAPTRFRVAAEIDERAGLEDRFVAALQVRNSEVPVASLIVRDAARRVDRVKPAAVYPLDSRRSWFVAGAGLLVLAVVAVYGGPSAISSMTSSASGASTAVAGADGREVAGRLQPADAESQPATATPGAGTNLRSPTGDSSANLRADAQRRAAEQQDSNSSTQASDANRVRGARPAAASPPLQPATESVAGAASGSAGSGGFGRGGSGTLEGAAAAGTGASGIGRGAGAGGVRGQRASGTTFEATALAPAGARSEAEYAGARARAGVAISRDQVPPDLRNYVRDYFIAIAPQTESK
jgi:hypothetical protein